MITFEAFSGGDTDIQTLYGVIRGVRSALYDTDPGVRIAGALPGVTGVLPGDNELTANLPNMIGMLVEGQGVYGFMPNGAFTGQIIDESVIGIAALYGGLPGMTFIAPRMTSVSHPTLLGNIPVRSFLSDRHDSIVGRLPRMTAFSNFERVPENVADIAQSFYLYAQVANAPRTVLSDSFVFADANMTHKVIAITESIQFTDVFTQLINDLIKLVDGFSLHELVNTVLKLELTANFDPSDATTASLLRAMALIDSLALRASTTSTAEVTQLLAVIVALSDMYDASLHAGLVDSANVAATIQTDVTALSQRIDNLRLQLVQAGTLILTGVVTDSVIFNGGASSVAQVIAALNSGVMLTASLSIAGEGYTAWVMNPETRALSQYTNFPFNSYALVGGRLLAATTQGVYALEGDDDDGTAITAALRTGLMNLGTLLRKKIEKAYLGYAADGALALRVTIIDTQSQYKGEKVTYTYRMVEQPASSPRDGRLPVGRGLISTYWAFEFVNEDGGMMELHDLQLLPMILTGRIS